MTLQEKVVALSEITPQIVRETLTFEDFKFEILEAINKGLDYDALSGIFIELDNLIDKENYNVINERILFKSLFLHIGLKFDIDVINALLVVEPLIKLDFDLNQILSNIEFYKYLEEIYVEYRKNVSMDFSKLSEAMDSIDFKSYLNDLEGGISKLKEIKG